jgi:hypothetical protein
MLSYILSTSLLVSSAFAAIIDVTVGMDGKLSFNPEAIVRITTNLSFIGR